MLVHFNHDGRMGAGWAFWRGRGGRSNCGEWRGVESAHRELAGWGKTVGAK
jgi:hypothetical protein